MNVIPIDSGRDPRLADYLGVREPARLVERGQLIAEGRFVVRRLLEQGRLAVRSLLLNPAALGALGDAIGRHAPHADVFVIPSQAFVAATGFTLHRGCLALAGRPVPAAMDGLLAAARVVVVLERIVDADNIGGIFRNAEAFGADGVLLGPGCCDPFYRKAIRTSSGATCVVPHALATPWPDVLDAVRAAGFTVVATTPETPAASIGEFVRTPAARGRVAVLVGTEGHGLSAGALSRADLRVRIPMAGALDSLNVATAAGIVLQRLSELRR